MFKSVLVAFGTLTSVRVPINGSVNGADLARSTIFYPVVGLVIGGLLFAVLQFSPLPYFLTAALALVAWILATGALHLDGWADCSDAALAPWRGDINSEKSIEHSWRKSILKDPHIGSFGVIAVAVLLILKFALLASLLDSNSVSNGVIYIIIATVTARVCPVIILDRLPRASSSGLAAQYDKSLPLITSLLVTLSIIGSFALYSGEFTNIIISTAGGVMSSLLLALWLSRKFGGVNGDVCGAAIELCEVTTLIYLIAGNSVTVA